MQAADETWSVIPDFVRLPNADIVYIVAEKYQKTWHHFLVKRNDSEIIAKWLIGTSQHPLSLKIAPYLPNNSLIWVWQCNAYNCQPICLLLDGNTGKLITQLTQSLEISLEINKISTLVDGKYIFATSFDKNTIRFQVWKKNDNNFEFKKVYTESFNDPFYKDCDYGSSHFLEITRDQKHCLAHHRKTVYAFDISNREQPRLIRQFQVAGSSVVLLALDKEPLSKEQLLVATDEQITAWDISNITENSPQEITRYALPIHGRTQKLQLNFDCQFIFVLSLSFAMRASRFFVIRFGALNAALNDKDHHSLDRRIDIDKELYSFIETLNGTLCTGKDTFPPPRLYAQYYEKFMTSQERRDVLSTVLFEYLNPRELINPILEYAGLPPITFWQNPEPQTATTSTTVTTTSTATATTSTAVATSSTAATTTSTATATTSTAVATISTAATTTSTATATTSTAADHTTHSYNRKLSF